MDPVEQEYKPLFRIVQKVGPETELDYIGHRAKPWAAAAIIGALILTGMELALKSDDNNPLERNQQDQANSSSTEAP